jgi:hypothetical protein
MRDGLYRNLPLSIRWRAALKSMILDAERGTIAREKVERATAQDLQREIQPRFKKAFREKTQCTDSWLCGFNVFDVGLTSRDLGGDNSPLENELLVQASHLEAEGLKGEELERQAYISATREHMLRRRRQIEQTILTEGCVEEARAAVSAAQAAFQEAVIEPIIEAFRADQPLELPAAQRPIDLDEDLSRSTP